LTHTRVDRQNKHDPRVLYDDIRPGHHVHEKGYIGEEFEIQAAAIA